jgi:hypothetical protein
MLEELRLREIYIKMVNVHPENHQDRLEAKGIPYCQILQKKRLFKICRSTETIIKHNKKNRARKLLLSGYRP